MYYKKTYNVVQNMKPGDVGQFERGDLEIRIAGAPLRHPISETNKLRTVFPFSVYIIIHLSIFILKLRPLTLKD